MSDMSDLVHVVNEKPPCATAAVTDLIQQLGMRLARGGTNMYLR